MIFGYSFRDETCKFCFNFLMLYRLFRHFFLPRLVGLVVKAPLPKAVVRGCGTSPAPRRAWCPGRPGMGCTPPWRCQTGVTMSWLSLAQQSFTSQTPPTQTGRTSSSGRLLWECQLPMELAFNPALSCLMQVKDCYICAGFNATQSRQRTAS